MATTNTSTASTETSGEAEPLWNGRPSQIINTVYFAVCIVAFVVVSLIVAHLLPWARSPRAPTFMVYVLLVAELVPVLLLLTRWLQTNAIQYELDTEQLLTKRGVLSQNIDALELYRIRDYKVARPIFLRLFGLGNIVMPTSDLDTPVAKLVAIHNVNALRDVLRRQVEECRVKKGVREIDDVRSPR